MIQAAAYEWWLGIRIRSQCIRTYRVRVDYNAPDTKHTRAMAEQIGHPSPFGITWELDSDQDVVHCYDLFHRVTRNCLCASVKVFPLEGPPNGGPDLIESLGELLTNSWHAGFAASLQILMGQVRNGDGGGVYVNIHVPGYCAFLMSTRTVTKGPVVWQTLCSTHEPFVMFILASDKPQPVNNQHS
eukprot:m51a1_g40 hypothetical protein (186) ;mRNA; r:148377-149417